MRVANLIEEELVGRGELCAEALIELANQGRKLHIFVGLARTHIRRSLKC